MDGHSSQELRARREAHARAVLRRRLSALAALLAVGVIAALSLGRQAPAGGPTVAAPPATGPNAPVGPRAARLALHDGPGRRPQTLTAVRRLVPALRRRGYRLVSLPDLLRDDPPPRDQKLPRSFGG